MTARGKAVRENRATAETKKPVIAIYVRYYLAASETFIYRQLQGVRPAFDPMVIAAHLSHQDMFPTDPVFARGKTFPEKVYGRLAGLASGRYAWAAAGQRSYWRRQLTERGARLIHAHFGHFALDVLPIATDLGIPLVVTFHGMDASVVLNDKRYLRALPKLVDYAHVITVSHNMAERLRAIGIHPRKLLVHYIGAPVEDFPYVERLNVAEKIARHAKIRFLQVANFIEVKGHRYTLEAFARYVAKGRDAELVLAGDGPLRGELASLCDALGIRDRVRFPGRISKAEVIAHMAEADAFLQHSVSLPDGQREGLPTVLMEAMSTGLPVISTRHSGIPELVEDGVDGFLVEERDVDAYVSRMESLESLGPELGRRARAKVERTFNLSVQNGKLIELYRRIIDAERT
jgi:glycosyltransferase involved in cell wall biosynthesis